ncbi:MAG: hypothetical protein HQ592_17810 [Planctomycetes bacterium]|nr:hypothetical protein [Planctomycetota bacterium]
MDFSGGVTRQPRPAALFDAFEHPIALCRPQPDLFDVLGAEQQTRALCRQAELARLDCGLDRSSVRSRHGRLLV